MSYNFNDIFKSRNNDSKPSFIKDVIRLHTHNSLSNNKSFILDREDQFEGFFSKNFQDQIEQRSLSLNYNNKERLTREAVFEHANFSLTNNLLNNANDIMVRLFNSFETPNLFDDNNDSEQFGRETLYEFLNILNEPDPIRQQRIQNSIAPNPIAEMDYKFDTYINNNIENAENSSRYINKDIKDFIDRVTAKKSLIDYFTKGGQTRTVKIMDKVNYISRPGILPAIGMIHDAESELSINIYQLQNKPIIDYLTADLKTRAEELRAFNQSNNTTNKFKFTLQLAWNKEFSSNKESYTILSPNIVAIRTFQNLAAKYSDVLDINIKTLDRRNHTKLLFSDQGAYLSTQNQTAPVGKSLYQAGSNYEFGRYFKNISNPQSVSENSEKKLYNQIKDLQIKMFSNDKLLQTNQPNISGPVETYEMMRASLKYLHQNKGQGVRVDFILDQVFLLQYDSMLFDKVAEGEMGPESKETLNRLNSELNYKKIKYREEIQEPLLLAAIEGIATVTTDIRNYKQNVQEPIYKELMTLDSFINSNYNLDKFLNDDISLSTEDRITKLENTLNISRSRAIQLLAMASGNIQPANIPRQHVKASLLYKTSPNIIEGIAGEVSSSNRSLYSMSLVDNDFEREITNNELGMMYYSDTFSNFLNVNKSNNVLNVNESNYELQEFTKNYLSMKSDITTKRVGQLLYTNVNNRAEWEKDVDRKKLVELFTNLNEMNKLTGESALNISFDYDTKGPISILINLNNGLKYKFTALQGGINNQGFIYEINKSKIIGESDFINQSSQSIKTNFIDNNKNPLFIKPNERLTLSPIQTTMSMISSIVLESNQIDLIRAPLIEYQNVYAMGLEGNQNIKAGIAKYLLSLSGHSDLSLEDVLDIDDGSIIKGALENLQLRMTNKDATLDKIRQFAGINIDDDNRKANLQYLTDLIQVYGNVNKNNRLALITGDGLKGKQSLKHFLTFLFSSNQYADLLYDFIQSQNDSLYKQFKSKYTKEVSNKVFDPYLTRTQVSVYSSTQAYRQRVLYGINERRSLFGKVVDKAANSNIEGIFRLAGYSLASSPFEHDSTDDFGTDFKKGSLLFIEITGTGGSKEKSGLEYDGYYEYDNLLPYYQHKKIGTATTLDLIQDTGVGFIIDRKSITEYNESVKNLNINVNPDELLGGTDDNLKMLLFNFDVKKKASQIPQRLKNVIGSRPNMELTTQLQELIEVGSTKYLGQDYKSIESLRSAYLTNLRNRVGDKANLITDMYGLGIEFGGQIKSTLSNEIAEVLESIRQNIEEEFENVDEQTKNEILRVRLLNADLSAHSVRGFIGSSKRTGDSFVLFQLSGAYSDYSFLNPDFGSVNNIEGIRVGFADRAVKGHQASKLSSQRLLDNNKDFNLSEEILIKSGSYIKRDKETNLFHIFSFDETSGEYVKGNVISSRKDFTIVKNILEAVKAEPSIGKLGAVSNAASFEGEMAIEILRDVRILEGEITSNEIRFELDYIRTLKSGGGRRQESLSGGLVKMVPMYLYNLENNEKGLLRQMYEQFESTSKTVGSFAGINLNYNQFYGVVNPSNLKSYFYEHGSQILIDNTKKTSLLNTDGKILAAALIMSFGTSRFNKGNNQEVLNALTSAAANKELGQFYQDYYLLSFIKNKGDSSKIGQDFINNFIDKTTNKENISNLQIRALEYIGLDLIKDSLSGDTNAANTLRSKIENLLTDSSNIVTKDYLNIGKDRGREMAIIAASLDYFVQLTKAEAHDIAVLDTTKDKSAYLSLGTIGGVSYEDLIKGEQEGLSDLINQLSRRSYTIGMFMSLSGSQSKVAISSKLESFIENQHIIFEPFYTNLSKFKRGSALDSLRKLMAGFYGAMTQTHTGEFINSMSGLHQINLLDIRNPIFSSKMIGYYNDPFISDSEFKEYQKNYEMFAVLKSFIEHEGSNINAALIENIINIYRQDAKGLDINPDILNTKLTDLINYAKNNDLINVKDIIDKGYNYSLYQFERIYTDFRLNPEKSNINIGQVISTGLQRSAGSSGRFAFTIPVLEFNENTIKIDKSKLQQSFSFAGEDLKIIGESFGTIDNPLQKSQIIIWNALAPNSAFRRFLDKVNDGNTISEVPVSLEDYDEIMKFYTTAINMPYEITEAIGVYGNKILGNKIGFSGGTTTPAALFMGGTQMSILPETILERHGGLSSNRIKAQNYIITKLKDNLIERNKLKQKNNVTKKLTKLNIEDKYYTYLSRTLNKGISAAATIELNVLINKSTEFQQQLKQAGSDSNKLDALISEIESGTSTESKYSIAYYKKKLNMDKKGKFGVNINESGDAFIDLLGLYELRTIREAAILQGGATSKLNSKAQQKSKEFAEIIKEVYSPFKGLMIGSDNNTNLPNVTSEEMALEMRRGSSKLEKSLRLNFDNIHDLEGKVGKIYLDKIISSIESFAVDKIKELEIKYKSNLNEKLSESTITKLKKMISDVKSYNTILRDDMTKSDVRTTALLLTGEVEKYHAEINLGITQSIRPSPMGGSYLGRSIYDTFGLGDVNKLMNTWGLPISFTPKGQDDLDHRNKTLHLFNPYSWLQSHLGDFDGDMITNMFRTTSQLDLKVKTYDAFISSSIEELSLLNTKLQTLTPNTNDYDNTQISINLISKRLQKIQIEKTELNRLSNQIKNHSTLKEYQIAAAKWVGNYMKVDYKMFLGQDFGGFRPNGDHVPVEVLFTYTEQGRGLYGAMESIVTKSMNLFYDFRKISETKITKQTWNDAHNRLANLENSDVRDFVTSLPEEIKNKVIDISNEPNQSNKDIQIAEYVSKLYSTHSGLDSLQKYNLKGIDGTSISPDVFIAMENTLGQAGSVILGKSYNTMVGMLYTEAPILALSYALLNDPDDNLKSIVIKAYGNEGIQKYDEMLNAAKHSFLKSQQVGGFLQSTQQILRDSIKPKDANKFLSELEDALLKYKNEEDGEKKQKAYNEIVKNFGPGKGLNALIEMESLVQDLNILNTHVKDENSKLKLEKTLDKYELTDSKKEDLLNRLGYDKNTGDYEVFKEKDSQGNIISRGFNQNIAAAQLSKEYILAAYKTKQDMVSVVSDFAYSKGLNEGESTGNSLLSLFTETFNKFDSQEQSRINKLVQAADSYFNSSPSLVALPDAESQAFIEALIDRGNLSDNITSKKTKWNYLSSIDSEEYQKKLYEAHVYALTSDSFGKTVGDNGELFIRFAQFNQARKDVYSNNHWKELATGFDILSDPLAMAEMLGMVSGKVTPEFIGKAMRSVTNAVKIQTGESNPSLESITNTILKGTGMNTTPQDRKLAEMFAFVQTKESSATKVLMDTVASMALGQITTTAKEFIEQEQFKNQENLTTEVLKKHFSKMGFSNDDADLLSTRASISVTQGAIPLVNNKTMMTRNQMVNVIGSLGKNADVKAQSFIFPLLGIIGSALATGDLSPEAFQVAAGTALTNLNYVRWNNLEENFKGSAMNFIGGSAFKMRLALQEHEGDAGKALISLTTRELIMGTTSAIVNKYASNIINKSLGGFKTLDFDRFESSRNVATSTLTAVTSTLLGMMLGKAALSAAKMINPEINESEQALREINQINQQKVFNQSMASQDEENEDLIVQGDDDLLDYQTFFSWGDDNDIDYSSEEWSINENFTYAFNNTPIGMYSFELT